MMDTSSCPFGLNFLRLFSFFLGGDNCSNDTSSSELLQYLIVLRREVRKGGCRLIPASAIQSEYLLEESLLKNNPRQKKEWKFQDIYWFIPVVI